MVWFECGDCGESLKKPKVEPHLWRCSGSYFTCLDCSRSFDSHEVKKHTTCVTEQQKYADGATKPGGFAAGGYFDKGIAAPRAATGPEGLQYLSSQQPWKCSICKVTCTSRETLEHHAAGVKHKRRAKAISAASTPATAADSSSLLSKPAITGVTATSAAHAQASATQSDTQRGASLSSSSDRRLQENELQKTEQSTEAAVLRNSGRISKPKWKSLALRHLQAAKGHCMKLSKLQKQLLAECGDMSQSDSMLASLNKSSKFQIEGKRIALTTV